MRRSGVGFALAILAGSLTLLLTGIPENVLSNQVLVLRTDDGLSLEVDGVGSIRSLRLGANGILAGAGGFRLREISLSSLNRAPNPGFEAGTTRPDQWSLGGPEWTWDSSVKHSGFRSARISVPPPADQVSSELRSVTIPLTQDTAYDFSAWVRTEHVGGSYQPAIRVVELDEAGNYLLDENGQWIQHAIDIPQGTADWQSLRIVFRTHTDCRKGYVYANIWNAYGTIWFDDITLASSLGEGVEVPVTGSVTSSSPRSLIQRADLDPGLTFTASYTAHPNHIRIDGAIQDHLLKERGLQISFNLPMVATGWEWGTDIRHQQVIEGAHRYENIVRLPYGGSVSQYPFASLTGPPGGISLAVPMDAPRIQRTSYAQGPGYQIMFDLGLSPATTKLGPGRATFSLLLYTIDPSWGFRAAAEKYYAIFPQFFVRRATREGLWIGGFDPNKIPNASDFGFAFDQDGDRQFTSDAIHEIMSFRYLEPWGWWRKFSMDPVKPSYEERVAALMNDAANEDETWEGAPLNEVAQGVLNTSLVDAAGRYYLDASDHFWHYWGAAGNPGYYQNYPTNPDPDIPLPNRSHVSWQYEIGLALQRAAQSRFIDHWTFGHNAVWDTSPHSGFRSALVSVPLPLTRPVGYWRSELIPVTPGRNYELSAWMKGEVLGGSGYADFFAVEFDASGEPVLPWTQHSLVVPRGSYDWLNRSVAFTVGSKTRTVYIYGVMWEGGVGKVWFDDVVLRDVNMSVNMVPNAGFEENRRGEETGTRLAGAYLDSLHVHWAWSTLENYRQDHWTVADHPLAFSYETKRPVQLGFFTHYDFVDWIAQRVHADDRLLMGNIFFDAYPYFAHRLDVLGSEIAIIDDDTRANIRRTLSYQKPNSNLMQWHLWEGGSRRVMSRGDVEAYIKSSLFYGFYPSIFDAGEDPPGVPRFYWQSPGLYERDRDLFRFFVPLIQTINQAGWEPVTQASTDNQDVWVERFGPKTSGPGRVVYFTVHNSSTTTKSYTLTVDAGPLGFDPTQCVDVTELTSASGMAVRFDGNTIRLKQTIAAGDTTVFKLASADR